MTTPKVRHVLVAGPGGGSIGDEAMYLAFVRNTDAPVTVVARRRTDLLQLIDDLDVEYVYLPNLLYGSPFRRLPQLLAFLRLTGVAASVSFIGADTMDGVYSNPSSVRRFRTARQTALAGTPTRILGFSWNSRPTPQAVSEMRRSAPYVDYLMRDRGSRDRIIGDGATRVHDVADLAFLTRPSEGESPLEQWMHVQRQELRRIILVNANPFLERWYPDQFSAYQELIIWGLESGMSFAFVPHDTGGVSNDLTYEREMASALPPSPHVFRQETLLSPQELVRATSMADAAVSGRMHFAILCSVAGTPAITLSYQDKVSGLYELLGLEYWLSPGAPLGEALQARLSSLLSDETVQAALAVNVPRAITQARRNLPTQLET